MNYLIASVNRLREEVHHLPADRVVFFMAKLARPVDPLATSVEQLRRFERLYETHLQRLEKVRANEDFTVADVRIVHELGFVPGGVSGVWLSERTGLDPGYVRAP